MANKEKAHFWVRLVLNALLWILNRSDRTDDVIETIYDDVNIKVSNKCKQ